MFLISYFERFEQFIFYLFSLLHQFATIAKLEKGMIDQSNCPNCHLPSKHPSQGFLQIAVHYSFLLSLHAVANRSSMKSGYFREDERL